VWRAHQITLDRPVLILELKPELSATPESRALAFNSVRHLTESALPLFPDVIDLLRQGSTDYIILEDANITSVLAALNGNRLNAEQLLTFIQQLAESFQTLHAKGLVYRAFSPSRLFITEDAAPILPDVTSIARGTDFRYLQRFSPRHISELVWASPEEHAPKTVALDARADIFSIGLTLYALATGQIPFGLLAPEEIPEAKRLRAIPSPCDISAHFPPALSVVLSKMTQRDLELRYASWEEVLEDLAIVQAGAMPQIQAPERSIIAPPSTTPSAKAGHTIRISIQALKAHREALANKKTVPSGLIIAGSVLILLILATLLLGILFS
jgi:serine/threonine protein kinase